MIKYILSTLGLILAIHVSAQTTESQNAYIDKINGGMSEVNTRSVFYLPSNSIDVPKEMYYMEEQFQPCALTHAISGDTIKVNCRYRLVDDQVEYMYNNKKHVLDKTYIKNLKIGDVKFVPVLHSRTKGIQYGQELFSDEKMSIVRTFDLVFENQPSNPILRSNMKNAASYESLFFTVQNSHAETAIPMSKKKLSKLFPHHESDIKYFFSNYDPNEYDYKTTNALEALFVTIVPKN